MVSSWLFSNPRPPVSSIGWQQPTVCLHTWLQTFFPQYYCVHFFKEPLKIKIRKYIKWWIYGSLWDQRISDSVYGSQLPSISSVPHMELVMREAGLLSVTHTFLIWIVFLKRNELRKQAGNWVYKLSRLISASAHLTIRAWIQIINLMSSNKNDWLGITRKPIINFYGGSVLCTQLSYPQRFSLLFSPLIILHEWLLFD